jgi:hypothetical protein
MCRLAIRDGQVDLDSCPLLAGLSPEERRRKSQDPRLKACMARAASNTGPDESCLTTTGAMVGVREGRTRGSTRRVQLAPQ